MTLERLAQSGIDMLMKSREPDQMIIVITATIATGDDPGGSCVKSNCVPIENLPAVLRDLADKFDSRLKS